MSRSHHPSQDENVAPRSATRRRGNRRASSPGILEEGRRSSESLPRYVPSPVAVVPIFPRAADNSHASPSQTSKTDRHQEGATKKAPVNTCLSSIGVKFVGEVRPGDIKSCMKFINANLDVLKEVDADEKYSSEAATAFEEDNQTRVRNCIEKGLIVASCAKLSKSERTGFFQSLFQGNNKTARKFYEECERRERDIAYQVQSRAREQARKVGNSNDLHLVSLERIKSQTSEGDEGSNASTIRGIARPTKSSQETKATVSRGSKSGVSTIVAASPLSKLGHEFSTIRESKYDECWQFLRQHLNEIDFTDGQLMKEAERVLAAGQRRSARRFIQQALLLQKWRDASTRDDYFRGLQKEGSSEMADLLKDFDKTLKRLDREVSTRHSDIARRASSPNSSLPESEQSRSAKSGSTRSESRRAFGGQAVFPDDSKTHRNKVGRNQEQPALSLPDMSRPDSRHASSLPSPSRLDPRYQIRKPNFYTFGRVLALIWHDSAHRLDQDVTYSVESARFPEPIFSYVRRMAVVKSGHGFCWCVPISTYGGRGLSKAGLNPGDINAHAIIYLEGESPRPLPSEPRTSKHAICIQPASEDQHLAPASRINFAKIYTIEYSARAMNVGKISDKSLSFFRQYCEEQLKLD